MPSIKDIARVTAHDGRSSPPWQAEGPEDIKYDFAAFPVYFVNGRFDPLAFLKVDNDVWQFRYERD